MSMVDIKKMREDWKACEPWLRDTDGWEEAELTQAKEAIKKAIDTDNKEMLLCWSGWLTEKAEHFRGMELQVREAQTRIHARIDQERKEEERKAA